MVDVRHVILILITSYVQCTFIPIILEFRNFYEVKSVWEAANTHIYLSCSKVTALITKIFCLALKFPPKNQKMDSTVTGLLRTPLRICTYNSFVNKTWRSLHFHLSWIAPKLKLLCYRYTSMVIRCYKLATFNFHKLSSLKIEQEVKRHLFYTSVHALCLA